MQHTPKLNLKKPDLTDSINVQDLNDNMDVLDTAVSELQEGSASIPDLETNDKTFAGAINELKQTVNDVETNAQHHEVDYVKHPGYGVTTNVGAAYAVTLNPAPPEYKDGLGLLLKLNVDTPSNGFNVNVNGLGAKQILTVKGFTLTSPLKKDSVVSLRYSSTAFNGLGAFILQGESEVEIGKQIITPSTTNQTILKGLHDGAGYVKGDANLISSNIKSGVNIFNVIGSMTGITGGNVPVYNDNRLAVDGYNIPSPVISAYGIRINNAGKYRIFWRMSKLGSPSGGVPLSVWGQIYVNGLAVSGTLRQITSDTTTNSQSYADDIELKEGDIIRFGAWTSADNRPHVYLYFEFIGINLSFTTIL